VDNVLELVLKVWREIVMTVLFFPFLSKTVFSLERIEYFSGITIRR